MSKVVRSSSPSPSSLLSHFRTVLDNFTSSQSAFQVVHTCSLSSDTLPAPKSLYILDSSFNPPTFAHQAIASSTILSTESASQSAQRLILLLATQNADKAPKPASFEQRLAMMVLLARDVLHELSSGSKTHRDLAIDIAITRHPYFVDKATAIASYAPYSAPTTEVPPVQTHLLGFDSLIRLLDAKYYPPSHTLAPLEPLFSKHRVRVTMRLHEGYGSREDQELYLKALADGKREEEGGKKEWAEKIVLVDGEGQGVSSTKARGMVEDGEWEKLEQFVSPEMREWIKKERLYRGDK